MPPARGQLTGLPRPLCLAACALSIVQPTRLSCNCSCCPDFGPAWPALISSRTAPPSLQRSPQRVGCQRRCVAPEPGVLQQAGGVGVLACRQGSGEGVGGPHVRHAGDTLETHEAYWAPGQARPLPCRVSRAKGTWQQPGKEEEASGRRPQAPHRWSRAAGPPAGCPPRWRRWR